MFLVIFPHFPFIQTPPRSYFPLLQASRSLSTALNYVSSNLSILQCQFSGIFSLLEKIDDWVNLGFFWGVQHLDTPDNNPDLPWEFSEANKQKVSLIWNACNWSYGFYFLRHCRLESLWLLTVLVKWDLGFVKYWGTLVKFNKCRILKYKAINLLP